MANVKGREVASGENVIYKVAVGNDIPALTVEQVLSGENLTYRLAAPGEIPNAIVTLEGSVSTLADPWDDLNIWDDTLIWFDDNATYLLNDDGDIIREGGGAPITV